MLPAPNNRGTLNKANIPAVLVYNVILAITVMLLGVVAIIDTAHATIDDERISKLETKIKAIQLKISDIESDKDNNKGVQNDRQITRLYSIINTAQSQINEIKNNQNIIKLLEINNEMFKINMEFINADNAIYHEGIELDKKYEDLLEQNDLKLEKTLPKVDRCWNDDKYVEIITYNNDDTIKNYEITSSDSQCDDANNMEEKLFANESKLLSEWDEKYDELETRYIQSIDEYDDKFKKLADQYQAVLNLIIK